MKAKRRLILFICFLIGVAISGTFSACKSDDDPGGGNGFDRKALLTNYADNFIIPSYQGLQTSVASFESDFINYKNGTTSFTNLGIAWVNMAAAWQQASLYNFGPAEFAFGTLDKNIGAFPVDTTTLQQKLTNKDFNTGDLEKDTRGIYAIEYLLYTQEDTIPGNIDSTRAQYIDTQIVFIKTLVAQVIDEWQTSYRATFVDNDAVTASSPITLLYNGWLKAYEDMKRFKMGLPLGLLAGQTAPQPEFVEAYYSGQSYFLLRLQFITFGNMFEGSGDNGFDNFVISVTNGDLLAADILNQIQTINNSFDLSQLQTPLSELIVNDFADTKALHDEMQALVKFIKSDFSSLTGLQVTFSDSDGD